MKSNYAKAGILGFLASIFLTIVIRNLESQLSFFLGIELNFVTVFITVAAFLVTLCIVGIFVGTFLDKYLPGILQFAKFGETGGLNFAVDFGVLNLLILLTGITSGVAYTFLKAISFSVAVSNSFLWNKFWVFKGKKKDDSVKSEEVSKFLMVSLVGLLLNIVSATLVVTFGSNFTSADPKILANIGGFAGSILALLFNFLGYKLLVFVPQKKKV